MVSLGFLSLYIGEGYIGFSYRIRISGKRFCIIGEAYRVLGVVYRVSVKGISDSGYRISVLDCEDDRVSGMIYRVWVKKKVGEGCIGFRRWYIG